jgi:type IV pilus assembly protein PilC
MNDTPRPGRTAVAQRPPVGFSDIEAQTRNGSGAKAKVPWYKREFNIGKAVKAEDLMNFSRQTASFLRAGIPIVDALGILAEGNKNKAMTEVVESLRASLQQGLGLSASMAKKPKVFPGYYVSMVRSAELTGRLDDAMDQLAGYIERDLEAKRKVRSALTYPGVVFMMAIGAVVVLTTFVLPRFKELFSDIDADLPLTTRALLGTTEFVQTWWWALLSGVVVIVGALVALFGGSWGKRRRDTLLLRTPVLGQLFEYVIVERFCRVLAAMVQAGVPLPDAVGVASDSTNNRVYQAKLADARTEMIRGAGFARPIAATELFPPAATQMIRVGESTGTLDKQLVAAAVYYERELTYKLKRFTDMFEPAVIVGVGLVVGFVAVALVQAMYGVFDQVQT